VSKPHAHAGGEVFLPKQMKHAMCVRKISLCNSGVYRHQRARIKSAVTSHFLRSQLLDQEKMTPSLPNSGHCFDFPLVFCRVDWVTERASTHENLHHYLRGFL